MAVLAHRLPVVLVPEQFHVALVIDDVIDDLCTGGSEFSSLTLLALAQRMFAKECNARNTPSGSVTTLAGVASERILFLLWPPSMLLASPALHQHRAAGVSTQPKDFLLQLQPRARLDSAEACPKAARTQNDVEQICVR